MDGLIGGLWLIASFILFYVLWIVLTTTIGYIMGRLASGVSMELKAVMGSRIAGQTLSAVCCVISACIVYFLLW